MTENNYFKLQVKSFDCNRDIYLTLSKTFTNGDSNPEVSAKAPFFSRKVMQKQALWQL